MHTAEPAHGGGDEASSEVTDRDLQRVDVVAGNLVLLLGDGQLPIGVFQLPGSVVD